AHRGRPGTAGRRPRDEWGDGRRPKRDRTEAGRRHLGDLGARRARPAARSLRGGRHLGGRPAPRAGDRRDLRESAAMNTSTRPLLVTGSTAARRMLAERGGLVVAAGFYIIVVSAVSALWRAAAEANGGQVAGYTAAALTWYLAT